MSLLGKALLWGRELEWPDEVVGFLEGGADGPDLVDEVLDGGDTLLSESVLDDRVVVKRNSSSVDLAEASLVNEASDVVAGWVTIGDIWLNGSEHVDSGSVEAHKHSIVELSESQELHDLLALGAELVDTKNTPKLDFSY